MKKKIFLIFSGVLLFSFVVCTAFLWYKVFYYGDLGAINTLQVQKQSDEATLNENLFPMTKEESSIVPNYKFSVKNANDFKSLYEVVYQERSNNATQTLYKSQLDYQLILNGKIIKEGNLGKLKNNVLDERYVMPNQTNKYELKVYITNSAKDSNWQNKKYAYTVNINVKENN